MVSRKGVCRSSHSRKQASSIVHQKLQQQQQVKRAWRARNPSYHLRKAHSKSEQLQIPEKK